MTEFGKALWLVVQDKGPYSRAAFGRLLGQKTGWEPSRQAISNWLKGERDVPRQLIPATAKALDLDAATLRKLEHLYFYGQDRENSKFTISDAPEITEENRARIAETEAEWDRLDAEEEARRGEDATGN